MGLASSSKGILASSASPPRRNADVKVPSNKAPTLGIVLLLMVTACTQPGSATRPASYYFKTAKVAEFAEASAANDLAKMEVLAAEGVDVNAKGTEGINLFYWVFITSSKEAFAKIYALGADPLREAARGQTVAFDATGVDDPDYLEILLKGGLDPNATNPEQPSETLLMQAIFYHRWPQFELLLKYCADINWADEYGISAATNAIDAGQMDMLVHLLEEGYSYDVDRLARRVDIRRIGEESPQFAWEKKAIAILEEKGITFPAHDGKPARPAAPSAEPVYAKSCQDHRKS